MPNVAPARMDSFRSARLGSINKVSYKPAMRFSKPNAWTSLIICTASLTTDDDFFVASVIADAPPSPRFFILSISPTDNMGTAASKHRPNFQEDDSDKPRPKPNAPTVWMNPPSDCPVMLRTLEVSTDSTCVSAPTELSVLSKNGIS